MSDHLGSPRIILGTSGSLADVRRRDFLPFGEDLGAGQFGRTTALGYEPSGTPSNPREKFATYERDDETGLDFAQARYYQSKLGRFTSVDPALTSGRVGNPQTWNRFTYSLNNPGALTDPQGEDVFIIIWTTKDQNVGHAAIAVSNYKLVERQIEQNGKKVTIQERQPDGTFTYFDLWPRGSVNQSNLKDNIPSKYQENPSGSSITLEQMTGSDPSRLEQGKVPDGVVKLATDYETDSKVREDLYKFQVDNPAYNAITNNCTDYACQAARSASGANITTKESVSIGGENATLATPNALFRQASKAPNASIVKNPGTGADSDFSTAIGGKKGVKKAH